MKETLKQAGYNYIRYLGNGKHLLGYIKGDSPFQFEVWFSNKNHASYGLIFKNTHLEFAHSLKPKMKKYKIMVAYYQKSWIIKRRWDLYEFGEFSNKRFLEGYVRGLNHYETKHIYKLVINNEEN